MRSVWRSAAGRLPGSRVFVALAAVAGCGEILAIPDRAVDPRIVCENGGCTCVAGFSDCDGDVDNGCEADLASNETCGACGVVCRHATCQTGACLCDTGWDDCDAAADNGCEADLAADTSCGACGRACTNGVCVAGACECQSGFFDCDGDEDTGCEVNIAVDPASCGACGHDCLGGGCEGGKCLPAQVLVKSPGEYVDDKPILDLVQLNPLRVEVVVPVRFYGKIKVGMTGTVEWEAPIGGSYPATVKIVDSVVDAASGTIGVRLELPNPNLKLPAGTKCSVRFPVTSVP